MNEGWQKMADKLAVLLEDILTTKVHIKTIEQVLQEYEELKRSEEIEFTPLLQRQINDKDN